MRYGRSHGTELQEHPDRTGESGRPMARAGVSASVPSAMAREPSGLSGPGAETYARATRYGDSSRRDHSVIGRRPADDWTDPRTRRVLQLYVRMHDEDTCDLRDVLRGIAS
jgi:hypothetical protein